MRKTVISLILIVPILFVFVLYGVTKVDLHATINANGIEVHIGDQSVSSADDKKPSLYIDLATYGREQPLYQVETKVTPEQATNTAYTYQYTVDENSASSVVGGGTEILTIDDEGYLRVNGIGTVNVAAVSSDGGYSAQFVVNVGSSKPMNFDFMLSDMAEEDPTQYELNETAAGYTQKEALPTGKYRYSTKLYPTFFTAPEIEVTSGTAIVDDATGTLLFPFSGKTEFEVSIPNSIPNGEGKTELSKKVTLDLSYPEEAPFTVNGIPFDPEDPAAEYLFYEQGRLEESFYIETKDGTMPEIVNNGGTVTVTAVDKATSQKGKRARAGEGASRYLVNLKFFEPYANNEEGFEAVLTVKVGGENYRVPVTFSAFSFGIQSRVSTITSNKAIILLDTPMSFYPVPTSASLDTRGITYEWDLVNANWAKASLQDSNSGKVCTITASEGITIGEGVPVLITAQACRDGKKIDGAVAELEVDPIHFLTQVQIQNKTDKGLALTEMVAEYKYDGTNGNVKNSYALEIATINGAATDSAAREPDAVGDLTFSFSADGKSFEKTSALAEVKVQNGKAYLTPKSSGTVYVKAEWTGIVMDEGEEVSSVIKLNVVKNGVEVTTSEQLFTETNKTSPRPIVLAKNIMLGSDDRGQPLPMNVRQSLVKRMKSTYNTQYFDNLSIQNEAHVNYIIEFKNDVYGNGYEINAEYIANAKDNTGLPAIFRGPICFVKMGDAASVAGQDNISFLVRTDGVTLFNLSLLGCSDTSLYDETAGANNLTLLNDVGTVLDVNCDAEILNCRVRNGRTVVRVYGGNKNGDRYFVKNVSEVDVTDYIDVNIEGCILTNGREFILKLGANHAIRSSGENYEPALPAINNKTYVPGGNYLDDEQFCNSFVLTDVTLKNSVLKTSGLFSVGVECNFAGTFLGDGTALEGWSGVGGTSFAAALRLVGDVRLYDWKDIGLVDSSTLIESNTTLREWLKLDVQAMIDFVQKHGGEKYSGILKTEGDTQYVHGGIAFYGGGKNYSQLDLSNLNEDLRDLTEYDINISELAKADSEVLQTQGQMLPLAAGTQDFRFFLYNASSANSYEAQRDHETYEGVVPVSPF